MNIKITYKWLLEYLDTDATPEEIQKYLSLCGPSVESVIKKGDDYIYDIEVTSNRVDSASVMGVAREAAAILPAFGKRAIFKEKKIYNINLKKNNLKLLIEDKEKLSRRIMSAIFDTVNIKPSPAHIRERLENVGIRSLNNLVDITNYLMIETGHPAHVFDYDRIKTGKFVIRKAKKGQKIITLDKKEFTLKGEEIVFDDGTGRIVDLPSIMGTENSVVTDKSRRVIFFIDNLDPVLVRRASMRHGIRTLAAIYNEKGIDPGLADSAFRRGLELFIELAGPDSISSITDIYPNPSKLKTLEISRDFIKARIGIIIPDKEIMRILKNLEFAAEQKGNYFYITPPSFRRSDIKISEDIVEEIARIYGYHRLPSNVQPTIRIKQPKNVELMFEIQSKIKHYLKNIGLNEVMNYSMVSEEIIEKSGDTSDSYLKISNTISKEIEYMRRHLTPSLLKNIKDNEGKTQKLKFFEIAKTYTPKKNNLTDEKYFLAICVNSDYHDLKGIVDSLLYELNISGYEIKPGKNKIFANKFQGEIYVNNEFLGKFGKVNPSIKNNFKIVSEVYSATLSLEKLVKYQKQFKQFTPISPFAVIKLDKTFTIAPNSTYEVISMAARQSKLLQKIEVLSTFKNKLTLRFYYSSPSRNITEDKAKNELKKI